MMIKIKPEKKCRFKVSFLDFFKDDDKNNIKANTECLLLCFRC